MPPSGRADVRRHAAHADGDLDVHEVRSMGRVMGMA
jgi:hypothetical protein